MPSPSESLWNAYERMRAPRLEAEALARQQAQQQFQNDRLMAADKMDRERMDMDRQEFDARRMADQEKRAEIANQRVTAIAANALRLPVEQRKQFLTRSAQRYAQDFQLAGFDMNDLPSLQEQDDADLENDLRAWAGPDEETLASQNAPASVLEYQFLQSLSPEQRDVFLNLKRQPSMPQVIDYQGGKAFADRVTKTITPISSAQEEATGRATVAGAEATAKASAEREAGIQKKGSDAVNVLGMLDMADPLIDAATGSLAGAGMDALAGFLGFAPDGAQAVAQLKVLQAALMTNMPRMEGPQSDRDVQLYREAAGQIGDPRVPAKIKKAAVQTIRQLQKRYQQRAGRGSTPQTNSRGWRLMIDANGNQAYVSPDGKQFEEVR